MAAFSRCWHKKEFFHKYKLQREQPDCLSPTALQALWYSRYLAGKRCNTTTELIAKPSGRITVQTPEILVQGALYT